MVDVSFLFSLSFRLLVGLGEWEWERGEENVRAELTWAFRTVVTGTAALSLGAYRLFM